MKAVWGVTFHPAACRGSSRQPQGSGEHSPRPLYSLSQSKWMKTHLWRTQNVQNNFYSFEMNAAVIAHIASPESYNRSGIETETNRNEHCRVAAW